MREGYRPAPFDGEADVSRERDVFPDATNVLNHFETNLFPVLRDVSEPHVGQLQKDGDSLHTKYARFSRAEVSALIGLDGFRARAETLEGETRGEYANAHMLFRRNDDETVMRSYDISGDGGRTTVRYKKVTTEGRDVEQVDILEESVDRGSDRRLRVTFEGDKYKVAFEYNSDRDVTVRTTATFKDDSEGQIVGAAMKVHTYEGQPVD